MERQVRKWMEALTLEEKASLCSGLDLWHTKAISRLGIPSLLMTDGPHGVRLAETGILSQLRIMAMGKSDTIMASTRQATCFPSASAMAATWNVDMVEHIGEAMGREAKGMGVNLLLAPGINIVRTPLGGRNFEFYSEDPLLSSAFGIAMTRGIQSQGVGAVVKHFACNNSEYRRMTVDVIVDDRSLHELYLKAFKRLIEHVKPAAIMSAYNKINGEHCSESEELLTNILRNKWQYDGIVISDWAAVYDRLRALQAGLDLEMPGYTMHDEAIVQAVESGQLDESVLDRSVERLLKLIANQSKTGTISTHVADHHGLAAHAAAEAFVLLKNEEVLPLATDHPIRITLLGEGWTDPIIQGEGSSKVRAKRVDSPIKALKTALHPKSELVLLDAITENNEAFISSSDAVLILASHLLPEKESEQAHKKAKENTDGEGGDKRNMALPLYYEHLISKAVQLQDKVVVGILSGTPVDVGDWVEEVSGLIMLWLGGEGIGQAIADVLSGTVNPSGRLPVSWPHSEVYTSPSLHFPGEDDKLFYSDRVFVGYRYALSSGLNSLYPFGYGLSYSEFEFSDAKVNSNQVGPEDRIYASVKVENIGHVAGKTVVQVYSRRLEGKVPYPFRQLVAFKKVSLQPGEVKRIELEIDSNDLMYYNVRINSFELEPGEILLEFGQNCIDVHCKKLITAINPKRVKPYLSKYSYLSEWLEDEDGKTVIMESIRTFIPFDVIALGHPIIDMFREMPLIKIVNFTGGLISEEFLDHLELALVKKREQDL